MLAQNNYMYLAILISPLSLQLWQKATADFISAEEARCSRWKRRQKKAKSFSFDRTIILLPGAKDLEQQVDICIPRGREREKLGHNGMIRKVRLASDMSEDEIFPRFERCLVRPLKMTAIFHSQCYSQPDQVARPYQYLHFQLHSYEHTCNLWQCKKCDLTSGQVLHYKCLNMKRSVNIYLSTHWNPEIVNNQLAVYYV